MFKFPDSPTRLAECILYYKKDTREDYLSFLVVSLTATPEEQAEYAKINRLKIDKLWSEHIEKINTQVHQDKEKTERDIIYFNKTIIKLRALGYFDFANKREELVNNLTLDYNFKYQGFVFGWGDDHLTNYETK